MEMNVLQHVTVNQRYIELSGAANVRDLGGYRTQEGQETAWHRVLRADSLHKLTAEDKQTLRDLDVRHIIDLRFEQELAKAPNVFADDSEIKYDSVSLVTGNMGISIEHLPKSLAEMYIGMIDESQDAIRKVLQIIASVHGGAVLYHCTAGKDRTGVISALLLGLVGVSKDVIAADYALTAARLESIMPALRAHRPAELSVEQYEVLIGVEPQAMLDTLNYLDTKYNGTEAYLRTIGVTENEIEALKCRMTA